MEEMKSYSGALLLVVAIFSLAKAETRSLWSMQKFGGEEVRRSHS
jgi:hypothetical protein